jgi:hypothetical protein
MAIDKLLSRKQSVYFEFVFVLVIALLARGNGIFSLNWSCDDFLSIADPTGTGYAISQTSQLRFFAAFITRLVGWLGGGFPPLGVFWNVSHTASMVVFALALRRLWIPGSPSIYGVLIGLLFTLFPYHINLLAFQLQHPSMTMSYLTGAFALANCNRVGWWKWASVLALAASLSYQTMIAYFVAAALVLALILAYRHFQAAGTTPLAETFAPLGSYLQVIALGLVAYFGLALLSLKLFAIEGTNRTTFASLDAAQEKFQLLLNHLKRTAFGKEPSMVRSPKLLQSSLWAVVISGLSLNLLRRSKAGSVAIIFAGFSILVSIAIVGSAFLPTILMDHTSENPRNLLATVLLAAGLVALASLSANRPMKIVAIALAGLLALSYALITNTISIDLARLTTRDFLQASRMVERLDQLSAAKKLRTVVFIGTYSPGGNLSGSEYYQSGFTVPWAQLPLLQEASGQVFANPSSTDQAKAKRLSAELPPWPAAGSVAVEGDVGVVVLSVQANPVASATPKQGASAERVEQ